MMYVAWAAFYEGSTDQSYFDVLIPRVIDHILAARGTRPVLVPTTPAVHIGKDRKVERVAAEICQERENFRLLFIHADTGGREVEKNIAHRREAFAAAAAKLCRWPTERTVFLSPRREMEAWALADGRAVCRALGFHGTPGQLGLPTRAIEAERLDDPKARLDEIARTMSRRSYRNGAARLLPLIAQEQAIDVLRGCRSYRDFEASLVAGLASLGCL